MEWHGLGNYCHGIINRKKIRYEKNIILSQYSCFKHSGFDSLKQQQQGRGRCGCPVKSLPGFCKIER